MSSAGNMPWPLEPVLDMDDIQGIAVPGFLKPHQILLGIRYQRKEADMASLRTLLAKLTPDISTAADTLRDRREHRQLAKSPSSKSSDQKQKTVFPPLVAIGFGYQGLFDLAVGAALIPSVAYKNGMVARSALLGDSTTPGTPGNPTTWSVGKPSEELDILVVVAGDDRKSVRLRADEIVKAFVATGAKINEQVGNVRDDVEGQVGHEHFGFDDGVSQPGVRGRASGADDDFITDRYVDRSQFPAAALYGYPGQDLVWPGEFVIGYPQTGPDPLIPGPVLEPSPWWMRNGSYLVYRRLLQDVGLFWRTMRDEAERLSTLPGFDKMDEKTLASRLVGRWPSGAPVNRVPEGDDEDLGENSFANNHFRFDSNTHALKLIGGKDPFPQAEADPVGLTCPLAAHIRKVNTRDAPSDMGGRSSTFERRLLRVGVPFGPSLKNRYARKVEGEPERGLLFLSIQSSIEEQFEFLQARWINDESRPKAPSGHDMIVGQNAAAADGARRCGIFGKGLQQARVEADGEFVTASGGGYFFVPSITALGTVIAGTQPELSVQLSADHRLEGVGPDKDLPKVARKTSSGRKARGKR
ncbi:Dyp-type peroxidase [Bradyrhizobium sp. S3.5.5]|uniref:Dyp-type peroxidase n=1 Tax=Bradyrhizobium sp. S3.5.5 TaxID=3156430 RepID=UPI0033992466